MTGMWVLLGTLVLGLAAGGLLTARNGRVRPAPAGTVLPSAAGATLPEPVAEALDPAAPVTLVQISTTFCAPCRQTRALLSSLAERTDGLRHVDLDVTDRPEVARQLGVLRTPTTIALAPDGRELLRVGGVPRSSGLLDALKAYLP
ncbi:thiol reductase thioredoxin [Amycolatopsis antarctica]|uniref:Thiol reductase thioredoxin n=1 Tax=Amycolatopsis antarctica TaxID=1854586 RepID=A0A263D2H4_9PSEU|nr:thioredoxin family protein [Amycolatopsis antarctica]OZM71555.1 thiol reductase thioredoxin [Amycolatopsis antarctica]